MTNFDELRKTDTIEWCGRKLTLKEVIVTDLISLESLSEKASAKKEVDDSLSNQDAFLDQVKEITKIATGLDLQELLKYPPSKIKQLILEVEKLNEDFFWIISNKNITLSGRKFSKNPCFFHFFLFILQIIINNFETNTFLYSLLILNDF